MKCYVGENRKTPLFWQVHFQMKAEKGIYSKNAADK